MTETIVALATGCFLIAPLIVGGVIQIIIDYME